MLTHWELELVAHEAGDALPDEIKGMIAKVKDAVVKLFSEPAQYNRQRDQDLQSHGMNPCFRCRFEGIK